MQTRDTLQYHLWDRESLHKSSKICDPSLDNTGLSYNSKVIQSHPITSKLITKFHNLVRNCLSLQQDSYMMLFMCSDGLIFIDNLSLHSWSRNFAPLAERSKIFSISSLVFQNLNRHFIWEHLFTYYGSNHLITEIISYSHLINWN